MQRETNHYQRAQQIANRLHQLKLAREQNRPFMAQSVQAAGGWMYKVENKAVQKDKPDSINLYHNKDEVATDYIQQELEEAEDEDYDEDVDDEGDEEDDEYDSDDSFVVEDDVIEKDDKEDELEKVEKQLAVKKKITYQLFKKVTVYYKRKEDGQVEVIKSNEKKEVNQGDA